MSIKSYVSARRDGRWEALFVSRQNPAGSLFSNFLCEPSSVEVACAGRAGRRISLGTRAVFSGIDNTTGCLIQTAS